MLRTAALLLLLAVSVRGDASITHCGEGCLAGLTISAQTTDTSVNYTFGGDLDCGLSFLGLPVPNCSSVANVTGTCVVEGSFSDQLVSRAPKSKSCDIDGLYKIDLVSTKSCWLYIEYGTFVDFQHGNLRVKGGGGQSASCSDCNGTLIAADCITPVCGNGILEPTEECDDGNATNGDGCSDRCKTEVGCCDGGTPEFCGFAEPGRCSLPRPAGGNCGTPGPCCTDRLANTTVLADASCCAAVGFTPGYCPVCGDNVTEGTEECDGGNTQDGDGCSSKCIVEQACCTIREGDLCLLEAPQDCVARGDLTYNASTHECAAPTELQPCCENPGQPNQRQNDAADPFCCAAKGGTVGYCNICGNGVVQPGEECDDDGTANGDGCNENCTVEEHWTCVGGTPGQIDPSVCTKDRGACCWWAFTGEGEPDHNECRENLTATECAALSVQGGPTRFNGKGSTCPSIQPNLRCCLNGQSIFGPAAIYPDCCDVLQAGAVAKPGHETCTGLSGSCCRACTCNDGATIVATDCAITANDGDCQVYGRFNGTCPPCAGEDTTESRVFTLNATCQNGVCANISRCGDGTINAPLGEECDDGNNANGDGCDSTCKLERGACCGKCVADDGTTIQSSGCVSGVLQADCTPENVHATLGCPNGTTPVATFSLTELCDNTEFCAPASVCGDGVVNPFLGEQCDDENDVLGDGCDNCIIGQRCCSPPDELQPRPGCSVNAPNLCTVNPSAVSLNGTECTSEPCCVYNGPPAEPQNPRYETINTDPGCCEVKGGHVGECPVCGDGVIGFNEQCDDGNTQSGDGCSASCTIEQDHSCQGEPSVCCPPDTKENEGSCCLPRTGQTDFCDFCSCVLCTSSGGTWTAPGVTCNQRPCGCPPLGESFGACQYIDPGTNLTVCRECDCNLCASFPGSTFLGDDTQCPAVTTGTTGVPTGACCRPDGRCVADISPDVCPPEGNFVLPGETCTSPQPCCSQGDGTINIDPVCCEAAGHTSGQCCGNGRIDPEEQCDDNNTLSGDGCSSSCTVESPPAPTSACCVYCSGIYDLCAQTSLGGCTAEIAGQICTAAGSVLKSFEEKANQTCTNVDPASGVGRCPVAATGTTGAAATTGSPTVLGSCCLQCLDATTLEPTGSDCFEQTAEQCSDPDNQRTCAPNEVARTSFRLGDTCVNEITCPAPVCGNGVLEAGEQCDDGGTESGDGCSYNCVVEAPVTTGTTGAVLVTTGTTGAPAIQGDCCVACTQADCSATATGQLYGSFSCVDSSDHGYDTCEEFFQGFPVSFGARANATCFKDNSTLQDPCCFGGFGGITRYANEPCCSAMGGTPGVCPQPNTRCQYCYTSDCGGADVDTCCDTTVNGTQCPQSGIDLLAAVTCNATDPAPFEPCCIYGFPQVWTSPECCVRYGTVGECPADDCCRLFSDPTGGDGCLVDDTNCSISGSGEFGNIGARCSYQTTISGACCVDGETRYTSAGCCPLFGGVVGGCPQPLTCGEAGPDAYGYVCTDASSNCSDFAVSDMTGATVHALTDESFAAGVAIPFGFVFYGVAYNSLTISSNGFVSFDTGLTGFSHVASVTPTPNTFNNLIAPLWADMYPGAGVGVVRSKAFGAAPSRVFVVEFDTVNYFSRASTASYQMKLFEEGNNIEMHYAEVQNTNMPSGVSVGIENGGGTVGLSAFFGTDTPVASNTTLCFTPPANATGVLPPQGCCRLLVASSFGASCNHNEIGCTISANTHPFALEADCTGDFPPLPECCFNGTTYFAGAECCGLFGGALGACPVVTTGTPPPVTTGEATTGTTGVPAPVCGNSIVEAGEECDDGGTTPGDGCSATCTSEACCRLNVASLPCNEGLTSCNQSTNFALNKATCEQDVGCCFEWEGQPVRIPNAGDSGCCTAAGGVLQPSASATGVCCYKGTTYENIDQTCCTSLGGQVGSCVYGRCCSSTTLQNGVACVGTTPGIQCLQPPNYFAGEGTSCQFNGGCCRQNCGTPGDPAACFSDYTNVDTGCCTDLGGEVIDCSIVGGAQAGNETAPKKAELADPDHITWIQIVMLIILVFVCLWGLWFTCSFKKTMRTVRKAILRDDDKPTGNGRRFAGRRV